MTFLGGKTYKKKPVFFTTIDFLKKLMLLSGVIYYEYFYIILQNIPKKNWCFLGVFRCF